MVRALVTGVTGQDGSYLVERLLAEGTEVHGLVRATAHAGEQSPPAGVVLHHGDLTDPGLWPVLIDRVRPDEIYNLGGLTSVGRSWAEPVLTSEVTGMAVARMLAAVEARVHEGDEIRVLQASSAEIFAGAGVAPQDEETAVRPLSPYGAAKAFAHHLAGVYRRRGVAVSCAILYNHESPRRPSTFVTRKITAGVADIARGRADRLVLGNLDARRDWGWAPDYVDAMVRAVRHHEPDDYVVATGVSHTVRDFAAAAFAAAGVPDWESLVHVDPALVRPAEAYELRGDASRARERLGWRSTVGFDELVARLVAAELAGP